MSENPKELAQTRDKKPPLDLLEYEPNVAISWAMKNGADKYGRANYRTIPISMRTYIAAIERHAGLLLSGEDYAEDSGIHHLAHIGANVHVLLKAIYDGNAVDDRGPSERTPDQDGCPADA